MALEKTAAELKAKGKRMEERGPRTAFTQGCKGRVVNYLRQRTAQGAGIAAMVAKPLDRQDGGPRSGLRRYGWGGTSCRSDATISPSPLRCRPGLLRSRCGWIIVLDLRSTSWPASARFTPDPITHTRCSGSLETLGHTKRLKLSRTICKSSPCPVETAPIRSSERAGRMDWFPAPSSAFVLSVPFQQRFRRARRRALPVWRVRARMLPAPRGRRRPTTRWRKSRT